MDILTRSIVQILHVDELRVACHGTGPIVVCESGLQAASILQCKKFLKLESS